MTEQSVICGNKQPDKVKPMAKVEAKGSGKDRGLFNNFLLHSCNYQQRFGALKYVKYKIH